MTLEAGDPAPAFELTDHSGASVSLASFAGSHLILYFYPRAFTPGCTTQACDFRDRHQAFTSAGYRIAGVSPDSPDRLAAFRQEHRLPFPMLSDPDHSVATAYGAWGPKKNYGREYEGIIRSTFAIGPDGEIEGVWRNVRAKGHVDRMEREVGSP